jgi:hypothetical protein
MLIEVLFLRIKPHQAPTRLAGAGEARLALALDLAMEPPPLGWHRRIQWVAPVSAAGFSWIYRWHGPIQAVDDGVGAQPLPEVGQSISPVLERDTCNSGIMLLHGGRRPA